MKRYPVIILNVLFFLTVCQGAAGAAQDIVAVQSIGIQPYEEALNGFKSISKDRVHRLIISEMSGASVSDRINEIKPALVLAIGVDALAQVKRVTEIPVVYLMVLNPPSALSGKRNVYGVRMGIRQEQQLHTLFEALPATKAVGLLYNPDRTGDLTEKAREAVRKKGARIIAKTTRNSRAVPSLIQELKGQIDVFLMLPDLTVVTPETVEALLLFSLENKVPLVTFSEKYVEMGALMSIGVDSFDMGVQAGEMAEKILSGRDAATVHQVDARKAVISINLKVAKTLGVTFDVRTIRKAKAID